MYISITYAGVEGHINGIREQLRDIQRLRDGLRDLYRQAENAALDPAPFQRCADELQPVEESMRRRMEFLGGLITDMRQVDADIGEIIDRM